MATHSRAAEAFDVDDLQLEGDAAKGIAAIIAADLKALKISKPASALSAERSSALEQAGEAVFAAIATFPEMERREEAAKRNKNILMILTLASMATGFGALLVAFSGPGFLIGMGTAIAMLTVAMLAESKEGRNNEAAREFKRCAAIQAYDKELVKASLDLAGEAKGVESLEVLTRKERVERACQLGLLHSFG